MLLNPESLIDPNQCEKKSDPVMPRRDSGVRVRARASVCVWDLGEAKITHTHTQKINQKKPKHQNGPYEARDYGLDVL